MMKKKNKERAKRKRLWFAKRKIASLLFSPVGKTKVKRYRREMNKEEKINKINKKKIGNYYLL